MGASWSEEEKSELMKMLGRLETNGENTLNYIKSVSEAQKAHAVDQHAHMAMRSSSWKDVLAVVGSLVGIGGLVLAWTRG